MNNSTIFTHFYFIKYVFVLVFKKIPLYRGFPLNLLTLNRGPTVYVKNLLGHPVVAARVIVGNSITVAVGLRHRIRIIVTLDEAV